MTNKNDNPTDWVAIRIAYEAGGVADRALARQYGISLTAIQKQAKRHEWLRPPGAKQHGGAISRVAAVGLGPIMRAKNPVPNDDGHKATIERARELVDRLLDELSSTTSYLGEIEEMIEEESANDRDGRRQFAMKQAITLSTRAGVLKNLALAAKTLSEASPGKREDAADAAKNASKGEFAVPDGPRLVVNGR